MKRVTGDEPMGKETGVRGLRTGGQHPALKSARTNNIQTTGPV